MEVVFLCPAGLDHEFVGQGSYSEQWKVLFCWSAGFLTGCGGSWPRLGESEESCIHLSIWHDCGPGRTRTHALPAFWKPLALSCKVRTPILMAGPSPLPFRDWGSGCPDWPAVRGLSHRPPRCLGGPSSPPTLRMIPGRRSGCLRLAQGKQSKGRAGP